MKFFRYFLLICIGLICFSPQSFSISTQAQNIKFLPQAVNQGGTNAQSKLGNIYYNGIGVPQDYNKALPLFTKAVLSQICNGFVLS